MSNSVYGFIETDREAHRVKAAVDEIAAKQVLGIHEVPFVELHSLLKEHLPKNSKQALLFEISDGKEEWNAEYLVDKLDYALEADIGLPTRARERQELLICLLEAIAALKGVSRVFVAVTESHQIQEIKVTHLNSFRKTALRDFEIDSPPNILYIIDKIQD